MLKYHTGRRHCVETEWMGRNWTIRTWQRRWCSRKIIIFV